MSKLSLYTIFLIGYSCHASIEADLVTRASVEGLQTSCLAQVALPDFVK